MSLKKCIKKGQASIEYFIIFTVTAGIVLLSLGPFTQYIREKFQGTSSSDGAFQRAVKNITKVE